MGETREFPTAVIASLSSGVLLCDFSAMHEAAEYLMGHPIWMHNFGDKQLWSDMQQTIIAQCPSVPTTLEAVTKDNYLERLAEIEKLVGKSVMIKKGDGHTAISPLDCIPSHLKDKTIVVEV